MKPLPHHYEADLTGGPSGCALTAAPNVPALCVAEPLEYDGPGDRWTPEHLLLASVEACLLLTFRARARYARLSYESVHVHATGTVDRFEGVTRFTEIVLHARVGVSPGTDIERIKQVLEKSEQTCLVTASLSTPIRLIPEIVMANTEHAGSVQ